LAAFHAALDSIGVAQYNLVRLSSVIPPGTAVDGGGRAQLPTGQWGDRLYCVYAERRISEPGRYAWAGMGWVQRRDGQGGLFVEHDAERESDLRTEILNSLQGMVAGHEESFGPPQMAVNGVRCTGDPACSLVLAPYETSPWNAA
jgi:arginine decarboxylase